MGMRICSIVSRSRTVTVSLRACRRPCPCRGCRNQRSRRTAFRPRPDGGTVCRCPPSRRKPPAFRPVACRLFLMRLAVATISGSFFLSGRTATLMGASAGLQAQHDARFAVLQCLFVVRFAQRGKDSPGPRPPPVPPHTGTICLLLGWSKYVSFSVECSFFITRVVVFSDAPRLA